MRRALLVGLLVASCAPALRTVPPGAPDTAGLAPLASLAAIQGLARRVEREADGRLRASLAAAAVEEGQRCGVGAPGHPACDYGLALALGLQARERPATAAEGLRLMRERLRRAEASEPSLDQGGPARVAALLLLRAPGWPLGPGDPEAGLDEARSAVALFPAHPPNLLALAEALWATGAVEEGRRTARRARELALQLAATGEPDAEDWIREAERLDGLTAAPPRGGG